MNFNDGTTQRDLDKGTTAVNASHETGTELEPEVAQDGGTHLQKEAMESAKRAQHRIHQDEQETPGSTLFTK